MARKKRRFPKQANSKKSESYDIGNALRIVLDDKGVSITTKSGIWRTFYASTTAMGAKIAILARSDEKASKTELRDIVMHIFYSGNFMNDGDYFQEIINLNISTYKKLDEIAKSNSKNETD